MNQKIALSYVIRKRYQQSTKKEKGGILDEFIKNTGYNRSYARRILGSFKKTGKKEKAYYQKKDIRRFCLLSITDNLASRGLYLRTKTETLGSQTKCTTYLNRAHAGSPKFMNPARQRPG